jgi:hypothetical protein
MKITFEDNGNKVIWDLDQININDAISKATNNGDFHLPLDGEVEIIVNYADMLRHALLTPTKAFGTEGVDPIRALIVLLFHPHNIGQTIDFNRVLQDRE